MAEFCLDCFNKMNETDYREEDVELEMDLCEGCGEIKPVVVWIGRPSFGRWCMNVVDAILWRVLWKRRK